MKKVITVIGFGCVGKALVYQLLANCNYEFEINVLDPSDEIHGSYLDMSHAAELSNHKLYLNKYDLLNTSDFIFHCAGGNVQKNETRLSVVKKSYSITRQAFKNFNPTSNPYIIVISNPVDVISSYTWKLSNLSPDRIIGTGTSLDSYRLRYYLRKHLGLDQSKPLKTTLVGEHGDSIVFAQSLSFIGKQPINEVVDSETLSKCFKLMKNAASKIKETQGATYYGVSSCAVEIMYSLLSDKISELTVSVKIPEEYLSKLKVKDLFLSIPVHLSKQGLSPCRYPNFNETELNGLKKSALIIESHLNMKI